MISKSELLETHRRIQPFIQKTPVLQSSQINKMAGCDIFFKAEHLQTIGAFKIRGAANAIHKLDNEQTQFGVTTHSSGNHAQAVAKMAQLCKLKAYIVMPETAPKVKVNAVKGYGAEITFCAPTLADREKTMKKIQEKTGACYIPPYDHEDVIAGQATAAMELLEEHQTLDYLITPVGGGGLLAGTSLAAHYFSNNCLVIGAEPEGANDAFQSFNCGKLVPSINPNTIADGLLTSLGVQNFNYIKQRVSNILCVSDNEIVEAMYLVYERMKQVIEPSSATALALVLKHPEKFAGKQVGIIISGGNVDLGKLPFGK